jgi:WD40 repeat protein
MVVALVVLCVSLPMIGWWFWGRHASPARPSDPASPGARRGRVEPPGGLAGRRLDVPSQEGGDKEVLAVQDEALLVPVPPLYARLAAQPSPLDKLDPTKIPLSERREKQPADLVSVIGSYQGLQDGGVTCVALSPDGKWGASGGTDAVVRLWDAATLREVAVLEDCDGVTFLTFSPDSKRLLAGGNTRDLFNFPPFLRLPQNDGWTQLWELGASSISATKQTWDTGAVQAVAFSANGTRFAVGLKYRPSFLDKALSHGRLPSKAWVELWDIKDATLDGPVVLEVEMASISSVAVSADGRKVAVSGESAVELWNLTGEPPPTRAAYLRGFLIASVWLIGTLVVLGFFARWLRRFAGAYWRDHPRLGRNLKITAGVAGTALGICLVASLVLWWNVISKNPWKHDLPVSAPPLTMTFAPDQPILVAASQSNTIRWDVSESQPREQDTIPAQQKKVGAVALTANGLIRAACGEDGTIQLCDLSGPTPRERAFSLQHTAAVSALALASDGKTLLTGSEDGTLRLWDLSREKPERKKGSPKHSPLARSIAFASDGKTLLVGCADQTVHFLDLAAEVPQEQKVLKVTDVPWQLAVSADGKTLALGCANNCIRLCKVEGETAREFAVLQGPEITPDSKEEWKTRWWIFHPQSLSTPYLAFSPKGTILVAQFAPERLKHPKRKLWKLTEEKLEELILPEKSLDEWWEFAFSPKDQTLALVTDAVLVWDLSGAKPKEQARLPASHVLGFTSQGQTLIVAGKGKKGEPALEFWDLKSKQEEKIVSLEGGEGRLQLVQGTFVPKAHAIAGRYREFAYSYGPLTVWSVATGDQLWSCKNLPDLIEKSSLFAPDGRHMAIKNRNGTVYILRLWGDGETARAVGHCDQTLQRNPRDFKALLQRGQLYLQQGDQGKASQSLAGSLGYCKGHPETVVSLSFLPEPGRFLAVTADGSAHRWDLQTGRELPRKVPAKPLKDVQAVAVSRDGHRAVFATADGVLRLWDLDAAREIRQFTGEKEVVKSLPLSADGQRVLSVGAEGAARLWDTESGKQLFVFRGEGQPISCAALSPDGQLVLGGADDGTLRLWNTATGKELRSLKGPGELRRLLFAPDGRRVLAASKLGNLCLLDSKTGGTLRRFVGLPQPAGSPAPNPEELARNLGAQFIESVAVSADGSLGLFGSAGGTLVLSDTATGETRGVFNTRGGPVTSLALSPDGRLALAGCGKDVTLFRLPLTWHQAIADLTTALELDPQSVAAHVLRSRCFLSRDRLKEALADVSRALQLDAGCKEAYQVRAAIHSRREDHDRAIADLTKLISLDEKNAQAHYLRGLAYTAKEDYARARDDLKKAVELDPSLAPK